MKNGSYGKTRSYISDYIVEKIQVDLGGLLRLAMLM